MPELLAENRLSDHLISLSLTADDSDAGVVVRFRLKATICISLAAILMCAPASAEQLVPLKPNWWPSGGYDLRPGRWIACNEGKWATSDCIESVEIRPISGGRWQPMRFKPNPLYVPETTLAVRGNDETKNDYSYFPSTEPGVLGNDGLWIAPRGITTNSANVDLVVESGFWGGPIGPNGYFQLMLRPKIWDVSLNDQFMYRIKVKSESLTAYARWVQLPSQNAEIEWTTGYILYTASPGVFFWPADDWDKMCDGNVNKPRASLQLSIVQAVIQIWNNEKWKAQPGEVVVSSNGNQCFRGLEFDKSTQTLNVRVGTVHFDTQGKTIEGWFNAPIARPLLRSWWDFDPERSKGSARVELTYEDGTTTVATSVTTYLETTQQLRIVASGFHYSSPLVSVSVIPEKKTSEMTNYKLEIGPLTSKSKNLNLAFDPALAGTNATISLERTSKGKVTKTVLSTLKLSKSGRALLALKTVLRAGDIILASAGETRTQVKVSK